MNINDTYILRLWVKVGSFDIVIQLISGTGSTLNNNALVICNTNKHKFQFTNNVFS